MEFTDAQIEKLRQGLHAYRVHSAVNGQRPAWKTVLRRIEDLRVGPGGSPRKTVSPFAPEALRRFAEAINTPRDPYRLDDIRRLLVTARVLSENHLAEEPSLQIEASSVHGYLANTTKEALWTLEQLAPVYRAASDRDVAKAYVELRLRREPQLTWFEVEEFNHVMPPTSLIDPDADKGNQIPIQRFIRKGYGFVSTVQRMLCIFVKGAYDNDQMNYFEVWPGVQWTKGDVFLCVVGHVHLPRRPGEDVETQMLKTLNVLQFSVQHASEKDVEVETNG